MAGDAETNGDMKIAGERSCADWKQFREKLSSAVVGKHTLFEIAYTDFFLERLEKRYFVPIRILQKHGGINGAGFSIVSIQCALIEFLQTTRDGTSFKKKSPNKFKYQDAKAGKEGDWTYDNCSTAIFKEFLTTQMKFDSDMAGKFYSKVRCGLLHEARTTGNWRITANPKRPKTISVDKDGVTYLQRDLFQKDLEAYVWKYKIELLSDAALQVAFIRKFDSLCA